MSEHGIHQPGQEFEITFTQDGMRLRINGSNRVASLPSSIAPERVSALREAWHELDELAQAADRGQEYTDKEKALAELLSASLFQETPGTTPDEQLASVLGSCIGALRDDECVRLLLSFEDAKPGHWPWALILWKRAGRERCLGRARGIELSRLEHGRAGNPLLRFLAVDITIIGCGGRD